MRLGKRILGGALVQAAIASVCAAYIRFVHRTTRWTVVGGEHAHRFWDAGRPVIGTFWHGRMLPMRCCWPQDVPIEILISAHRDGRLIARTIRRLGVGTVVGSSSRGGARATLAMRQRLQAGISIGITPDGPRGPRMRVAPGVVQLAALTGAPILPGSFSVTRARVLGSWDRFVLPLPFSRGVYIFGAPLEIPAGAGLQEIEALRLELEDRLNSITAEADRMCGRPAIEPAEAPPPLPGRPPARAQTAATAGASTRSRARAASR